MMPLRKLRLGESSKLLLLQQDQLLGQEFWRPEKTKEIVVIFDVVCTGK